MPENPIIKGLADNMPTINKRIEDLEELIALGRAADRDMTAEVAKIELLKLERDKWTRALQERGYLK